MRFVDYFKVEGHAQQEQYACFIAGLSPAMLKRGDIKAAPWGLHFDAYHQKLKHTWRPFGNANPLQQLLLKFIRPVLRGSGPE